MGVKRMHASQERRGCLGAILSVLGIGGRQEESTPVYRLRDDFLSPAELNFYRVLCDVVEDRATVFAKVGMGDLFYVPRQDNQFGAWNRINRKHLDFVLSDARTSRPLVAIELDDRSHSRADRSQRDEFIERVFAQSGLPLLRFPARRTYNRREIEGQLSQYLPDGGAEEPDSQATGRTSTQVAEAEIDARACERCGGMMRVRVAKQGPQAGKPFWGCENYPRCRNIAPM